MIQSVENVSQLQDWISALLEFPTIGLLIFFGFSNFLENVFPPWPGDTFTVFAGFLAGQPDSNLTLLPLIIATILGNWAGALCMFFFGKKVIQFLRLTKNQFIRKHYTENSFEQTVNWFKKHSILLIIFSRFSAGIRFFVAIVAGMSRMHVAQFLFFYTIAISIWCGALLFGGYRLGNNWKQILVILSFYNRIISIILILCCLGIFGYLYHKKKSKNRNESSF